jgi:protein NrfD
MMVISSVADLFFDMGSTFALGIFVAAIITVLGSGLLVFDLGRPLHFWRVFSREKAEMTFGAWMLSLLVVCGIIYGSCWLVSSPWYGLEGLRLVFAWICLLLGLGTAIYTGVFLGTIKARPFWNGPTLPILFLILGLSTGIAAQIILVHFWSWGGSVGELARVEGFLRISNIGLLVLEIIVLMSYVLIMRYSTSVSSAKIAATWLNGNKMLPFWVGIVGIGLVCPLALYAVGSGIILILAPVAVLIGGLILRFLVVYTDDRTLLPGEEELLAWLPEGNETFMHAWEE